MSDLCGGCCFVPLGCSGYPRFSVGLKRSPIRTLVIRVILFHTCLSAEDFTLTNRRAYARNVRLCFLYRKPTFYISICISTLATQHMHYIYFTICQSVCLFVCLSVCLSVCLYLLIFVS